MRFAILLIITIIAVVAGVAALQMSKETPPPAPTVVQDPGTRTDNVRTANVLVAKGDIRVGSKITPEMVDIQPWPEHLVLEGFVISGQSEVVGQVARSAIQARSPFLRSQLANENDPGFLAAALPAGMRAITLATDTVTGIAGFIFPGDRVDVLFAHDVPGALSGHRAAGAPELAEVLVSGASVLAVNIRETNPQPNASAAPSSITLEVSDQDAQRIRLAEKLGTLSMSLRSINDTNEPSPEPTRIQDLSRVNVTDLASGVSGVGVLVVRGPSRGKGGVSVSRTIDGVEADAKSSPAAR